MLKLDKDTEMVCEMLRNDFNGLVRFIVERVEAYRQLTMGFTLLLLYFYIQPCLYLVEKLNYTLF